MSSQETLARIRHSVCLPSRPAQAYPHRTADRVVFVFRLPSGYTLSLLALACTDISAFSAQVLLCCFRLFHRIVLCLLRPRLQLFFGFVSDAPSSAFLHLHCALGSALLNTLPTVLLFLPFSFPYNIDLLCRICFRLGNGCLLTPLLRLLSQVSLLLWVSPTSDKPSGSLRLQDLNRPYLISGAYQTSQVCRYFFARSPRSLTPTEPTTFSHIDCRITACDQEEGIGFLSI